MTAIAADEVRAVPTTTRARLHHWLPLTLLTCFAALLRLHSLATPDLWYDEAATFHRVTSSYADMLEILRTDGFVPLHYELYWLLARKLSLVPWQMRLIPAIAGTLIVPAIYLLARQFFPRRTALLAAAFAACSAWFTAYAHDAKMYMHFWLFVTLHVACFLQWLRTGRRLPFWCAAAAGCAMAGLHATGFFLVGLDVLFVLTHPNTTYRRALPFTLLVALVLAGPAGYYLHFNRFAQNAAANWNLSGIQWVEWRNADHSTPEILADTAAAHLLAYHFIPEGTVGGQPTPPPPPTIVRLVTATLTTLLAFAALALLPWPRHTPFSLTPEQTSSPRGSSTDEGPPNRDAPASDDAPPLPPSPRTRGEGRGEGSSLSSTLDVQRWTFDVLLPPPLTLFYLSAWILLPAYILYCTSAYPLTPPWTLLPRPLWITLIVLAALSLYVFPRTRGTLLPLAACLLLCLATYFVFRTRPAPGSLWMPRYLGFTFPATLITLAALFSRLPKPLSYTAIAIFLSANLTQSLARLHVANEPPISRVAQDVWRDRDPASDARTYVQVRPGFGPPGAGTITNNVGLYYLRLLSHQPIPPREFRFVSADRITPIRRYHDPALVAWDVADAPDLRRLTLWTESTDPANQDAIPHLLDRLGPAWHVDSTTSYPVRVPWTWSHLYTYQRTTLTRRPR